MHLKLVTSHIILYQPTLEVCVSTLLSDLPLVLTLTFQGCFMAAFFGFLRMSNKAPYSQAAFSSHKHCLRQEVIFTPPEIHLLLKWTKTLQVAAVRHFVQLSRLQNPWLCPVQAVTSLLNSRNPLPHFLQPPLHPI